jgi:glycosidase
MNKFILGGLLAVVGLVALGRLPETQRETGALPGAGRGYWPVEGAIYEVNLEYFPHHSIQELTARLPQLEKLGVSVIYLTPIFKCLGTAQYLILDQFAVNPRYGTEDDLRTLVATAHQHGIKVLLDLVTSLAYDGSYIVEQHPEWILRGDDGEKQRFFPFPTWGWALDCTNPEFIAYVTKLARYWVEKFDTDGWRVDSPLNNWDPKKVSGDHSRPRLVRAVKAAITEVKKEAILVSEISGPSLFWGEDDANEEPLYDEMCEASYNYELCGFLGGNDKDGFHYVVPDGTFAEGKFKPTLLNKVVHNQISSREFVEAVNGQRILYGRLRANFLENHDTERVQRAFPAQHRALFVLIATMPGVPVVHAGQEIGSTRHPENTDSDKNPPVVDWEKGVRELEAFYAQVLKLRASNPALLYGELRDVWKSGDKAIAFTRGRGKDLTLVALNFEAKPARCVVSILGQEAGLDPEQRYTLRDDLAGKSFSATGKELEALELTFQPYGYRLIRLQTSP